MFLPTVAASAAAKGVSDKCETERRKRRSLMAFEGRIERLTAMGNKHLIAGPPSDRTFEPMTD